jgi:TM2 domain-containing membrane protein YozV
MLCRNCGKEVAAEAVMCVACGVPPRGGRNFCHNCGQATDPAAVVCTQCGVALGAAPAVAVPGAKSKLAAGLLGILLGGLGIHRFYLGYTGIGVAQLVLCLSGIFTCGLTTIAASIWGLVEGILILTGSMDRDAQGNALAE